MLLGWMLMNHSNENTNAGKRPSMKQVAEYADVGVSTVSRVVSNHPDVSPQMRKRVLLAVQELGYEPDFLAQSLRRGATSSIGCAPAQYFRITAQVWQRLSGTCLILVIVVSGSLCGRPICALAANAWPVCATPSAREGCLTLLFPFLAFQRKTEKPQHTDSLTLRNYLRQLLRAATSCLSAACARSPKEDCAPGSIWLSSPVMMFPWRSCSRRRLPSLHAITPLPGAPPLNCSCIA